MRKDNGSVHLLSVLALTEQLHMYKKNNSTEVL